MHPALGLRTDSVMQFPVMRVVEKEVGSWSAIYLLTCAWQSLEMDGKGRSFSQASTPLGVLKKVQ